MTNFNLTFNQARAALEQGLRQVAYNDVLANWHDPATGAWLTIESPDPRLGVYVIAWRSTASYQAQFERVDVFIDPDELTGWATALKKAEEAFTNGPGDKVIEKATKLRANRAEAGRTGGQESGKTRREKALARKPTEGSSASSDRVEPIEPDEVARSEPIVVSKECIQTLDKPVPFDPNTQDPALRPKLDRSNPDWGFEKSHDFGYAYNMEKYKGKKFPCIVFRNQNLREDGTSPEGPHLHTWEVQRWLDADHGTTVKEGLTLPEAILLVNEHKKIDPAMWGTT